MRRPARRGSAKRERQAKRALAELRTSARAYARALDAMSDQPDRATALALDYWHAERRLLTAAERFARTET